MNEQREPSQVHPSDSPGRSSGRGWRWSGWALLLLLSLLLAVRLSLKSDWLLERIRVVALEQLEGQLQGNLSMDRLEGDLLYGITLHNLQVHLADGEPLGRASQVELRYHPIRLALARELDLFRIDSLQLHLNEEEDGRWNIQHLVPESDDPQSSDGLFSFRVHDLQLNESELSVQSPSLPEDSLRVTGLALRSNLGHRNGEWEIGLGDLRMRILQGRLPNGLDLSMAGRLNGEEVTLERWVVSSGRSWIRSQGSASLTPEGSLDLGMNLDPLAVRDLKAWDLSGLESNLTASLQLSGSLREPDIELDLRAEQGLQQLRLGGTFARPDTTYELTSFRLEVDSLRGERLTGIEGVPAVDRLRLNLDGIGVWPDPVASALQGDLEIEGLESGGQRWVDHVELQARLQDRTLQLDGEIRKQEERIGITGSAGFPEGGTPEWAIDLGGEELHLQTWVPAFEQEIVFNPQLAVQGRGFALEEPVGFQLQLNESRLVGESVDTLSVEGTVTREALELSLYGRPMRGTMTVKAQASLLPEVADFSWQSRFDQIDVGRFFPIEEFPTRLNGEISGSGRGWSREDLTLDAMVRLDSSRVNREWIETLQGEFQVRNERFRVSPLTIESPMVRGTVQIDHHLQDLYDEQNRMDVDLELLESAPFAPLVGLEPLQGRGTLTGRLYRSEEGDLRYEGEGVLQELVLGDQVQAAETSWEISGVRSVGSEGMIQFQSRDLQVQGYPIREVDLQARLTDLEDRFQGDLLLTVLQSDDHEVRWGGGLFWSPREMRLLSRELEIRAPQERIELASPFEAVVTDSLWTLQEVYLRSDREGAWMRLEVPGWSEERKEASMEVEQMNLATLQEAITGEVYGQAMASGWVRVVQESQEWTAETGVELRDLQWVDAEVERLTLDGGLTSGEIRLQGSGVHEGQEFLAFYLGVPFEQGDPAQLPESFFERPVEGWIDVRGRDLSWWAQFLEPEQRPDLGGELQIRSDLTGSAGSPALEGEARVVGPRLSGLDMSDVRLAWNYLHEESELRLEGHLERGGSRVASLEGELPLELDMRELRRVEPEATDPVLLEVRSDQIDLALFSSLLPQDQVRDLRGRLTGFWRAEGQVGNVRSSGEWQLREGRVRVVPLEVTVQGVELDLSMEESELVIDRFVARSGPGRAELNGRVNIADARNPELDLVLTARQLQVANRNNLNAIIDLDSRLTGPIQAARLTGDLAFRSGFVMLENFGEQAVEDVQLEEETSRPSLYEPLAMEMSVAFERQFFIRNRQYLDMEVELSGEVDLVKEREGELEMFGSLEGVNGYARPLGRQFDLENARVTFYGPVDDPELEIRTRHQPQRSTEVVTLWYIIEGTVQDPEFRFDSDPYLELQDILSYTLFGRPFYALESWQQTLSGGSGDSSAADVAMEILIERFGVNAARQLGVDVVEVDNNRTGSGNRTTIKTGWYLGERTFFAVLNEISGSTPKTLFMLEYMLTKRLELIVTQGDDSRQGLDLRWTREY